MNEIITSDGEIIETGRAMSLDTTMASALARAEIDTQVATARQYPRSIKSAINNILSLATLDEETAAECIYALKRGGKPIRGPSIRLAEIISSQWGNCRDSAMVVSIDRVNKLIVAEGTFHDLETNRGTRASVQRRISDSKGRLYNDDMIAVTGNAACSIARRNAILAGVPKGVWRKAVEAAEQIIRGDAKTLVERRDAALKALLHFNLSADDVFKILDVKGIEDIGLDDLATVRVIYTSLKNGDQTVEDLMRSTAPEKAIRVTPLSAARAASTPFEDAAAFADKEDVLSTTGSPAEATETDTDALVASLTSALDAATTEDDVERVWSSVAALGADAIGDRLVRIGQLRDAAMRRVKMVASKVSSATAA